MVKQSTRLSPEEFVKEFYPFAKQTQDKTGISALFILAQAALESAWNGSSPGWMLFGKKDTDGINGNEQLLRTSEYLSTDKAKFPEIISIKWDAAKKLYHYIIKDYFRKYNTPEECFTDHANFFFKYPRYREALLVKGDPYKFSMAIARAGYATAPGYGETLVKMINKIKYLVP